MPDGRPLHGLTILIISDHSDTGMFVTSSQNVRLWVTAHLPRLDYIDEDIRDEGEAYARKLKEAVSQ